MSHTPILKVQSQFYDMSKVFCILRDNNQLTLIYDRLDLDFDKDNDCLSWYDAYERAYIHYVGCDKIDAVLDRLSYMFIRLDNRYGVTHYINREFYHFAEVRTFINRDKQHFDAYLEITGGPVNMSERHANLKTEEDLIRVVDILQKKRDTINADKMIIEV